MASAAAPRSDQARAWREAFERLPEHTAPCYGLEGPRWGMIREAAIGFLDRFGGEAAALGMALNRVLAPAGGPVEGAAAYMRERGHEVERAPGAVPGIDEARPDIARVWRSASIRPVHYAVISHQPRPLAF